MVDDANIMVKCKITYPTDEAKNFIGGEVEATPLTLKIASISSFTVDDDSPIAGNSVTFTCVAAAESEPEFALTSIGNRLENSRFEITDDQAIEENGDEFTKKYVVISKVAYVSGQSLTCTVSI